MPATCNTRKLTTNVAGETQFLLPIEVTLERFAVVCVFTVKKPFVHDYVCTKIDRHDRHPEFRSAFRNPTRA